MPPDPHCVSRNPSWHTPLASQQPSGQLEGVHCGGVGTHAPPEQTSPMEAQSLHVEPATPHSAAAVPDTHLPAASQHPLHVPGLHGCATHDPLSHAAPDALQSWQASPPVPHAISWPPRAQTPPWQQPRHVTGPHVASQVPFTQSKPEAHDVHAPPCRPQLAVVVPPMQAFPAQQPEQFEGPHAALERHAPAEQLVPVGHDWHASPLPPHAESFVPGRHWLSLQQPLGHTLESQGATVVHTLPTQLAVVLQTWHASPPEPHASFMPPATQVLPWQQPAHVVGLHVGGVTQVPPEQTSPSRHA
jgi:hypothetical protein